jgi:hypothetical protein
MRPISGLLALLLLGLGGCANFKAVSDFSKETTKLTSTIRAEFTQIETICVKQAEIVIVSANIVDDGPLKECQQYKAAQGRLAAVTLTVLDDYAGALSAIADDKTFDLTSDVEGVGAKLSGLKDKSGKSLIEPEEVTAITKLVEVLANLAASREREAAVRRLVAEKDDLAITAGILRSYFVPTSTAPGGRSAAPYSNLVAISASELNSTGKLLRSPAMKSAEPIRSYELYRELETRRPMLAKRADKGPEGVPQAMASAIDAWLVALDQFGQDALSRDPKLLYDRLKEFRQKAKDVQEALAEAGV